MDDDDYTRWLEENPEPSLADLIRQHGGYGAITADAWTGFDRRMEAWQRLRRERYGGALGQKPKRSRARKRG